MKNLILSFLNDIKANYKTLILAFLVAFGFWVVASIQVFPTTDRDIKGIGIEAQITDYMAQNNLEIISDITELANIKIEGRRYEISDLNSEDFYASVNLSEVRSAGTYTLPIEVSLKTTDKEYSLVKFEPRAVTLTIDEIISKEFPLTGTAPDISLPDGYYAESITVSPEKITLTGSAESLNKITRIEARSFYHGELTESLQTNSELYIYSNGTRIPLEDILDDVQISNSSVSVNINILKTKELPLKLTIVNYPSNFDISSLKYEIMPKSITIASPDASIDTLSELNIGSIDISAIQLNKNSVIPIVLPEGYKNLSGNNNARIEWQLDNYGTVDFSVSEEYINITNAPDNYDVSLITGEVPLKVIGPSRRITGLSPGDITVNVNLLGVTLHEGSQDVGISIQCKGSRVQYWISGEYKVTINVQPKQEDEPPEETE
ncbi:MAG: hypothetical protein K2N38_09525 [Oscillospiraceae bacterium]|nr:hypothetical protein [Oscillospiraceae bacterium]